MSTAPPPPDFTAAVGPPLIGFFFNLFLCGVLVVQVYIYYMAFGKDQLGIRAIVYSVFILELAQTLMKCVDRFQIDVESYTNPGVLNDQKTSWFAIPILTACTSGIVQAFFGFRVYVFSKSWIMATLVWIATAAQIGSGIAQGVISAPLTLAGVAAETRNTIVTWVVSTVVCDVLIAVLLSYYLRKMKSGVQKSDKLITRIVRLTVETGTATAVWAILILVLFFLMPPWFLIFTDSIGKIYANNLMVMFNRRIEFTAHGGKSLQSFQKGPTGHLDSVGESIPQNGIRVREQTFRVTAPSAPSDNSVWELSERAKAGMYPDMERQSTPQTPPVPYQQAQSGWGV
ncbi:hypothetical protein DL96DRAFT_1704265 [Flagelloscypha sp. PMI_526]|nr:hypothetical protein DL96DRAFT_1704265 [Flagelloscypha sp. PMI_526]